MRITRWGVLLLVALIVGARLDGQGLDVELQRAVQREVATGDVKRAIADYKRIAERAGAPRAVAAQALLHLAEAYQRLGDADATRVYEQIASSYGDQANVALEAKRRLAAMAGGRTTTLTARLMWAGSDTEARISSDGRQIAVTDWLTGDLALRNVQTGVVRRILVKKGDTWGTTSPSSAQFVDASVLSPDQRQIAYSWYDERANGQLRIVSAQPGAAPRIVLNDDSYLIYPYAFSPDGKSILVTRSRREPTATLSADIAWVGLEDGRLTVVKRLDRGGDGLYSYPALSPDGKWIAYAAHITRDPASDSAIYVIAADGSSEAQIASGGAINEGVAWTQDGQRILFTSNRSGTFDLWGVSLAAGKAIDGARLIKADLGRVYPLGTTTAGSYLYARRPRGFNVWTADLTAPKPVHSRLSDNGVGRNRAPGWSPDGKMVAFKREREGTTPPRYDLIVKDVASGIERTFSPVDGTAGSGRALWFHDNRAIAIARSRGDGSVLRRVDLATGEWSDVVEFKFRIATATSALSGDDRTVYTLGSDRSNGRFNMVVAVDVPSGAERVIWKAADNIVISALALSPDGRRLALGRQQLGVNGSTAIELVGVDGSNHREWTALGRITIPESSIAWTRDSREIYFAKFAEAATSTSSTQYELTRINTDTGSITPLAVFLNSYDFRMDVRADDGAVVFSEQTREQPTVWSLDNIDSALR